MNALTTMGCRTGPLRTPMLRSSARRHRMWLCVLWLAVSALRAPQSAMAADQTEVERFGDLEVVTVVQTTRNADTGARGQTQHWSLRWQGAPLRIETWGGLWMDEPRSEDTAYAVFVLGDSVTPDLLVLLGDPNNGSTFHRLHQQDGQLSTVGICKTTGGSNSVRVLGHQAASPHIFEGPHFARLPAVTHLLLGQHCVYVVADGRAHVLPQPFDGWFIPYGMDAVALAPDGGSLVRLLSSSDGELDLWVTPFSGGHAYSLPIDKRRMRFATWQDIDETWMLHHFEWIDKAGKDHLVAREQYVPLPPRGRYLTGTAQYDVPQFQADGTSLVIEFLAAQPGAERLPDLRFEYSQEVSHRFRIDGETVVVLPNGFYVEPVSTGYWPGKPGDPERQQVLVRRLGAAFDSALAEGKFAQWFVSEDDPDSGVADD